MDINETNLELTFERTGKQFHICTLPYRKRPVLIINGRIVAYFKSEECARYFVESLYETLEQDYPNSVK